MPSVRIEVRRAATLEHESALVAAVRSAVADAFAVPLDGCDVRLVVHAPHRFAVAGTLEEPDSCVLVDISALSGRSLDAKRRLYRGIADGLGGLGYRSDHVKVLLHELSADNVAVRDGVPVCDAGLDYDVGV